MSTYSLRRALVVLVAAMVVTAPTFGSRVRAQNVVQTWTIEDVAPAGDTIGNSITVANGLAFDPQGRLVLSWGDKCACGGFEHETWARRDGSWQITPFTPGPENSTLRDWNDTHAMALTPSGTPIMVFDSRYAGPGYVDAIWSFKSDLNADPTGATPTIFAGVSGIDHWADIDAAQYAVVPGPDETVRTARFTFSNPRIILNGAVVASGFPWLGGGDYTVTPDGVDHVTYGSAVQTYLPSDVHYLRNDSAGVTDTILRADAWENALASDPSGGLHSVIKGGPSSQGNYGGTLEYRTSTDSGATWSAPELVDDSGAAFHATVAVDRLGVPGVAYWRWGGGLYFATREGGAWQVSQVHVPNGWNVRESTLQPRLAFDANNQPNIFFWDWETATMRLAVGTAVAPPPPTNHPPVAADDAASTDENAAVRIPVLNNDTDPDADDLRVTAVTPGKYGTTEINADLTVTYTPAPGFFGTDVFTYTVDDGHGGSAIGTVTVTVQPAPIDLRLPSCQVPHDSLVALWGGDGSPRDDTGHGDDGLVYGGVTYRPGVVNTAFRFDGASGYVQVGGADNDLFPQDGSFTLSMWVKTVDRSSFGMLASKIESGPGGAGYYLGVFQGIPIAHAQASVNTENVESVPVDLAASQSIADGKYHHIALVRENVFDPFPGVSKLGVMHLYIDGQVDELEGGTLIGSLQDSNGVTDPLSIGATLAADGSASSFFNGALDDVSFYRRALSPAELQAIVQMRSRAECGPPDDTVPPTLTAPSDIVAEATSAAGANVNYAVDAVDALDGPVAVTCSQASGTTFGPFTTMVTCSATDLDGNNSTASFLVTVRDTTPPVVTVPADITVEATGTAGSVVAFNASATDIVDGGTATTCAPASGSTFPIGATVVTCSSTDAHGNTAKQSFTVTVRDTTPPVLVLPGNFTTDAPATGGTSMPASWAATATDVVDGAVPVVCAPSSGSSFNVGTTSVTCTATDHAGNASAGIFTVTVPPARPPVGIVVTNPGTQTNYLGDTVTLPIVATDSHGYALTFLPFGWNPQTQGNSLPLGAGLHLNRLTGVISGTLTQAGQFTVVITVRANPDAPVNVTFTWNVIDHRRPTITQLDDQMTVAGTLVSLQVHAQAHPAGPLTYSAPGLPTGLTIDANTGLISGTPLVTNVGLPPYTVSVTVRDSAGVTATMSFSWMIVKPGQTDLYVEMTTAIVQGATPQESRLALTVTFGNHGPLPILPHASATAHIAVPDNSWSNAQWSCIGSSVFRTNGVPTLTPPWVSGGSRVFLFASPDTHGTVDLNIALAAAANPSHDEIVCVASIPVTAGASTRRVDAVATISAPSSVPDPYLANNIAAVQYPTPPVSPGNHPPTLEDPGDQSGIENDPATLQLSRSDVDGDPLRFGIVSGALPPGLTLDYLSGEIDGTVAANSAGDYPVVVAVTDGLATVTRAFSWHVAMRTVTLANPGNQSNAVGVPLHLDLQVADRAGNAITVTASGLPGGLAVHSSANGLSWWIDGTPTATKESLGVPRDVTLTASSGGMPPMTQMFTWTIGPNVGPTLGNPGPQFTVGGQTVSLQLHAADPYGDPVTYSVATALPPGLTLDAASGLITGTVALGIGGPPLGIGGPPYSVQIDATAAGKTASQIFPWAIRRNDPPAIANPGDQLTIEGANVSLHLAGSDPNGDTITFEVDPSAPLPTGLHLDAATGLITGLASAPASPLGVAITFNVRVLTRDQWGIASAPQTFTWTIDRKPVIKEVTNGSLANSLFRVMTNTEGVWKIGSTGPFYRLHVFDPDLDQIIASRDVLPPGVTWTDTVSDTGHDIKIGGTLTATGHWITTITAVDSHGAATTITIDWLVLENHQVDLSVTGSVDGQTTSAEATVQFEIRIENRGPAGVAHAPAFSMTIPGNIVSPYADGTIYWRCSVESGGAVTMVGTSNHLEASLPSHIATLQAGASIVCDTLPLRAANRLVKPYTFTGDSVTLSATVTASNDGFADDNTAVLVRNR